MVYAVSSSPLDTDTGGGTSYTYRSGSSRWNCSKRREEEEKKGEEEEEKEEEEEEEEEEMIDDDDDDDDDYDDDDFLSPASSVITVTVSLTTLVIELTAVTVIL